MLSNEVIESAVLEVAIMGNADPQGLLLAFQKYNRAVEGKLLRGRDGTLFIYNAYIYNSATGLCEAQVLRDLVSRIFNPDSRAQCGTL
jgi:hypothetical protein